MSNKLTLHCGAWEATRDQVEAVPVPAATSTYQPVSHAELLDNVVKAASMFDCRVTNSQFALNREGQQFFAVLDFQRAWADGIGFCVGLRNAYDQSMSVGVAGGERVFICDNLSFSGDWQKTHKHTPNVWKNLYSFLYGKFPELVTQHESFIEKMNFWKSMALSPQLADHLIVEAARAGAIPAQDILPVLKEYAEPTVEAWNNEPNNVWRLFNAGTQVAKKYSPILQIDRTRKLANVLS